MLFPRTYTTFNFKSDEKTRWAIIALLDRSCWFALQPLPDGEYEIAVKPEGAPCTICIDAGGIRNVYKPA